MVSKENAFLRTLQQNMQRLYLSSSSSYQIKGGVFKMGTVGGKIAAVLRITRLIDLIFPGMTMYTTKKMNKSY